MTTQNVSGDLLASQVKDAFDEATGEMAKEFRSRMDEMEQKYLENKQALDAVRAQGKEVAQKKIQEKGIEWARFVRGLAGFNNDIDKAQDWAHRNGFASTAELYEESKALSAQDATAGGYLAPGETANEVIELLHEITAVRQMGVRRMPLPKGKVTIPKMTGGATASYLGENENITSSDPTFGTLELTEKKAAGLVAMSNDLLRTADVRVDQLILDDLVAALADLEDVAFIRYDGTSHKPKGLKSWIENGVSGHSFASAGTTVANVTSDLSKMVRLVEDQKIRLRSPGFLMSPRSKWYLMSQRDGNNNLVWADELRQGRLMGFPVGISTQIPDNLGGGTDESEVYFCDFSHAILAESDQVEVEAMRGAAYYNSGSSAVVSGFSLDQTAIRAIIRHDFGLRHGGAEGTLLTGVQWI